MEQKISEKNPGEFPWELLKMREVDGIPNLILAIAQDANTGEILMIAYTDINGIKNTLKTKKMHYFSTSRKKSWLKGESSGNVQTVKDIYIDCDGDALLFKVEQVSGACHLGYRSCFFRKFDLDENKIEITGEKVFDPDEVY